MTIRETSGANRAVEMRAAQRPPARAVRLTREGWLERLFALTADAILVHGLDGRFVDCNPAAHRMLGYTRAEILTLHEWDLVTSASREELLRLWAEMQRGVPVGLERAYRRKDGTLIVADVRLTRFESAGRDLITLSCRDVTQRRRGEEPSRGSQRNLGEGQRLTPTGSWAWDPANDQTFWSAETFRIFGYEESAPSPRFQQVLRERIHSEDRKGVEEKLQAIFRQCRPLQFHFRLVVPDGVTKHIECTGRPLTAEDGAVQKLAGTVTDVSEWKRAEEALRASEQLARGQVEALRQALDALAEESALDKLLGRILRVMSRRMGAAGVSLWLRDETTELPVFHLSFENGQLCTRPDANHPVRENPAYWQENPMGRELLLTKRAVVCEDVEQDARLGAQREYLMAQGIRTVLAVPLLLAGRVIGLVSIRCTRPRKYRAEEIELAQALAHQATLAIQLTRLAEQSRQAAVLEERNRMAREIHDTLAQGFTGIIVQLEAAEDATLRGKAVEAGKHLRRVSKLAREGLAEARRSVQALRPQALEDRNLLAALDRLIHQMTPGSGLRAELGYVGPPRPLAPALEESLLRIGQEALTNTLKHAGADRFCVRLVFGPSEVSLEVSDNGRGFDPSRTNGGFGLTGMKERVSHLGGQLTIESAPGQGTRILVALPDSARSEAAEI